MKVCPICHKGIVEENGEPCRRGCPRVTFAWYQKCAQRTATYPKDLALEYLTLGLASEAGEVADKVKKAIRDHEEGTRIFQGPEHLVLLTQEIGDVLWYLSQLATELGVDFAEVAAANVAKLESRMSRNKIGGSGDDR